MYKHTVENKPIINIRGVEISDLHASIFDGKELGALEFRSVRLTERYNMRPDLISYDYYGSDEYTDLILKYNGISNPFMVCAGMVFQLPYSHDIKKGVIDRPISSMEFKDAKITDESSDKVRKAYKYVSPKNVQEIRSTDRINKGFNDLEIPSSEGTNKLPPNISKEGESPIISRNGRMYLEGNIDENCCRDNSPSISEMMIGKR